MLWITLLSCVVRYGDPIETVVTEPLPKPVDFSDVESRLAALLDGAEELDRQDRLRAAEQLAGHMKSQDPRAQQVTHAYLLALLDVEERGAPAQIAESLETGFSIDIPAIAEEELVEVQPVSLDEPGTADRENRIEPPDAAALQAASRALGDEGDLLGAMAALTPCEGQPCWDEVSELWVYTRDLYVYQQREAAAELFLRARAVEDEAVKLTKLREVEAMLDALLGRYPDTPYTAAISRNVRLVREEIAGLGSE